MAVSAAASRARPSDTLAARSVARALWAQVLVSAPSIHSRREEMQKAFRRGAPAAALSIALELEKLEPSEGRWPQQAGEALRKLGRATDAAAAFERAARAWARAGFVARAIAMGKTITQLDPSRTAILDELDPVPARREHRRARPAASALHDVPASLDEAAPALEPMPVVAAAEGETRPASERPLRFSTVPPAESIILDLSELDVVELSEDELLVFEEDEDDGGPEDGPSRAIETLALLPGFPLFAELPPAGLARLGAAAELGELPRGAFVLRRGDPADALYAIVEGAVRVRVPGVDEAPLLGEGDVFGEACLTQGHVRVADVVVERHLTALRIARSVLDELSADNPEVGRVLAELLGRRLLANVLATATFFAGFDRAERP